MSILKRLDLWADVRGANTAFTFLDNEGKEKEVISFAELKEKALKIAGAIQRQGSQRVVLFFPSGIEFIAAFLGCLYAQALAIPIPPPQGKRQFSRVGPVIDQVSPCLILTKRGMADGFDLPKLFVEDACLEPLWFDPREVSEKEVAFLQYTSGSTSRPKGVILTHGHIVHHQEILKEAFQHNEETKIVGWLPFYHDMGLIGNILHPLYMGISCTLMAPLTFIQRPIRWLEAISRYRATTSGGPNFAYQLCASKIGEEDLRNLDLSSWRLAFNGAERVRSETMAEFAKKFAPCGFALDRFYPCYGMAETTLFATGKRGAHSTERETRDVVNCGSPCADEKVVIVDPLTKELCLEKSYGEIWVAGRSVAGGYWKMPEETEQIFNAYTASGEGPFLRTGDLGFLEKGELFVLGRLKNMIILRGKNYFPHDLETCVAAVHPALSGLQGAAFSIEERGNEELVIVHEIDRHLKSKETVQQIFQEIKRALAEEFEIAPHAIVFVLPNSLPRTTSGKIQHFAVRQQFQSKDLSTLFVWEKEEFVEEIKEHTVLSKIAQLLSINAAQIAVDDPIIHLGVDSITGVQFLSWIQEKFGLELDLPFLLNGATVRDIEQLIEHRSSASSQVIETCEKEFPLSPNQENVWVSCQLQSSSAYDISFALRIRGVLDPENLKNAIGKMMQRHAPLRTAFGPGPVQRVADEVEVPLHVIEIQSEEEIVSEQPFDLTVAPLFRIHCFQLPNGETILHFRFHHLIFDGWSVEILLKELEGVYSNITNQYDSFVRWQQELFQSPAYKIVEKNWEEQLRAEEYPVLKISPFKPVEEVASLKTFEIDAAFAKRLKEFSAKNQLTVPIVLMAAFHAILHLYTGEKRVYVGFPSANRPRSDFQQLIGFFVNTLVCKTETGEKSSFFDLLMQVKEGVWKDSKDAAYPFQHLLQLLKPPRAAHSSPLFQAMFVMQNAPTGRTQFGGFACEKFPLAPSEPLYDLVLEVQQSDAGFELLFEFKKEKIPSYFAEEMGRSYLSFLRQAIEKPLELIESHELSPKESVIDLFEKQARAHPDQIAIYSDHGNMTYGELSEAVSSIAASLIEQGIQPSEPVGLCLERKPLLIASVLGILKAGGAYVPMDPTYPAARIETITKDAKIRLMITSELPKASSIGPFPHVNDLAYILYTSGSTGAPKGVMVSQSSLLNFALAAIDFFQITKDDRVLQFSSICWDTSSEEIYPALLSGAGIVLRGEGRVESFDVLLERTEKYQVTVWDLPSSYWHDLVDLLERKELRLPPSLRLVIVGGERVNRSKVRTWCENIAPNVQLLNTYGATEATSISAVFDLSKWPEEWEDVPIGRAIRNVELYVLNSELKPVPPGMPGDLYIGGAGLARGYLNLETLTSERFVRHPETGERIYRTGDLALRTMCGEVLLKGRADRQVKRRGFRIELEEIERVLAGFEGVETALVLMKGALIAYLVFAKEIPTQAAVKEFLRAKLPDYMIPDQITFLREIPRLNNGKIDFLSLDAYRIEGQDSKTEMFTEVEQKVASIWKQVLGLESIGKEESFFDVGGHSLLLIKLHEELQKTFAVKIDISTLFSRYTIASQAQIFGKKNKSKLELLRELENGSIGLAEAAQILNQF